MSVIETLHDDEDFDYSSKNIPKTVNPHNPQLNRQVGNVLLPSYSHFSATDQISPLSSEFFPKSDAINYRYGVDFSDKTRQDFSCFLPNNLAMKQWVLIELPWGIDAEGIYTNVALKLAREGIASIIRKPENVYYKQHTKNHHPKIAPISITRSVHTTQQALNVILPNHPELSFTEYSAIGSSKGGATVFAHGIDKYSQRNLIYGDAQAPAPLRRYCKKDWLNLLKVLPSESAVTASYILGRTLDPSFLKYEAKSVNFHLDHLINFIMTESTLFNGSTGQNFDSVNDKTYFHADLHMSDASCQPREWAKALARRSIKHATTYDCLEGLNHMDIPRRLPFVIKRILKVAEMSEYGQDITKIDPRVISSIGRKY